MNRLIDYAGFDDPDPFADLPAYVPPAERETATVAVAPEPAVFAGTRRLDEQQYVGVIRHNGRVVVECGHVHANRDASTRTNGRSARDCAAEILNGARKQATAEHYTTKRRNAWTNLSSTVFTASTVATVKAGCAEDATAYTAAVAAVRALLHTDRSAA